MARIHDEAPLPPLRPAIAVLGMVFFLVLIGWWVMSARVWFQQRTWREVTAAVLEVRYHRGVYDRISHNCSTGDDRGPRVLLTTYRYEVDGVPFTSTAYDHVYESELFCEEEPAQARLAELKATNTLTVYVDPDHPENVVQRRQAGSEVVAVLTLLFFAELALIAWWRRQRRRWAAYEAALRAHLEA